MKVAVAGSGIGGLITGLLLAKNGHSVTIFEKEKDIGGRLAFVTKGTIRSIKARRSYCCPTC
ncbi:NAD(P)-binding protein [Rossellomorea sp. H39__3]